MIHYRRLCAEDFEDIVEICRDIWDGADYLPELFHRWITDEGCFLGGIHEEANRVVVVGKYSILSDGSGWLEGLRVHPKYQGMGLAREITMRLLDIAKKDLEVGYIKKVGFSTHISSAASIHLMKQHNFKLAQQHITLTKNYDDLDQRTRLTDYQEEPWELSLEEFQQLEYFQQRDYYIPLAFVFQAPTPEIYKELKESGAFVKVNGLRGIFKFKGEPYFIAVDDDFNSINTYMNYYCLKYKESCKFSPVTTLLSENYSLIEALKQGSFTVMNEWRSDYYYFVYEA